MIPGSPREFASISVDPYGAPWRARFERCLDAATDVRCFAQPFDGYQPLGSQFATDVAMGAALMHAGQLASEAVQLVIADDAPGDYGAGLTTARAGHNWLRAGARQHVVRAPRTPAVVASGARGEPEGSPNLRLAAMLHIAFDGLDELDEKDFALAVRDQLTPLRRDLAALPIQPDLTLPAGNSRIAAFADPAAAYAYAGALLALPDHQLQLRVAGHYGLAHWLDSPAALVGRSVTALEAIAAHALPGVLMVSDPLACALQLVSKPAPRVEHVGEVGVYALYAVTTASRPAPSGHP